MRAEEIRPVDLTTGAGYDSQWALMRDLFVWLDLRLYYFYAHHQWLGPSSEMKNMLGLVVTREEFEHQLAKSAQMGLEEELEPEESIQLGEAQAAISLRLARRGPISRCCSCLRGAGWMRLSRTASYWRMRRCSTASMKSCSPTCRTT